MNRNPLVSVIITTYKRADMLERAIESVLKQTYSNIEIIVVDDNNPETVYRKNTEEIMQKFTYSNLVKYIKHEKNMNGAVARNTGIKYSKGEIITFLDDDDFYYPDKVIKQVNFLVNNPQFQGVYCGWKRNNKDFYPVYTGNVTYELLSGDTIIYTNSIMMWKDYAILCGGWDEDFRRFQEAVFLIRFFEKGFLLGAVDEVLFEFDISDRSNSLKSRKYHEVINLYLSKHLNIIDEFSLAKKTHIYCLRYRGVLLNYIKNKDYISAFKIYFKLLINYPITFNRYLFRYFYCLVCKD